MSVAPSVSYFYDLRGARHFVGPARRNGQREVWCVDLADRERLRRASAAFPGARRVAVPAAEAATGGRAPAARPAHAPARSAGSARPTRAPGRADAQPAGQVSGATRELIARSQRAGLTQRGLWQRLHAHGFGETLRRLRGAEGQDLERTERLRVASDAIYAARRAGKLRTYAPGPRILDARGRPVGS